MGRVVGGERHFECFSECPQLTVDVRVGGRALREVCPAPFETAVVARRAASWRQCVLGDPASGHGLGCTSWAYEEATRPCEVAAREPFTVRVRVRHTGSRSGRGIVQVCPARPGGEVEHPHRWLDGYTAVREAR